MAHGWAGARFATGRHLSRRRRGRHPDAPRGAVKAGLYELAAPEARARRAGGGGMNTNTKRPLEAIAADIRALERGNAFAIGALLAEAREDAEYGEWSEWLEEEFDWS